MASRSKPRTPLSRERVLRAAIRLADKSGIESLSMRKLAQALGVEAMSLYNHVANKDDLVNGMVDLVIREFELPSTPEWDIAIRECAVSAHEVLLRHPWACSLVMMPNTPGIAGNPRIEYMEWLLRRLREAGFSADLAYHAYHTLDSHILGFTMWELGHSAAAKELAGGRDLAALAASFLVELRAGDYVYVAEHVEQHLNMPGGDGNQEFVFGLDLILDGLKRARETA